ncbi:MAG: hypothetical protein ACYDBW_06590 [Sulfuricaulis sp.]
MIVRSLSVWRLRAVAALLGVLPVLLLPAVAQTPSLWLTTHKTLQRFNLDLNQVDRNLALPHEARALVLDPADGAVWALVQKQLLKFTADGQPAYQVDLTSRVQKWDEPRWLALNPYDASLWVAGEKVLLHLDAQGQRLQAVAAPEEIQTLVLDVDESLWLLGHQQLRHLSPQGTLLHSLDLKPLIHDPEYLVVDSLGGLLWVAGEHGLVQLDLIHPDRAPRSVPLPGEARGDENKTNDDDKKLLALAVDPITGNLWIVTQQNILFLYDRGTNLLKTVDLGALGIGKVPTLAFEPVSASFWLGGQQALAGFSAQGDFLVRVAVDHEIEALGTAAFRLRPTLSLLSPPDHGLTNNTRPPLRLGLGAECSGVPCQLADTYIVSLALAVELNGQEIGTLFSRSPTDAQYLPPTRLPEGRNVLAAQATDLFGHGSGKIIGEFTIDTVPPKFIALAPTDGNTVTIPSVTITGQLDDPTASVMLLDDSGTVMSLGTYRFDFAVALKDDWNTFTLVARDPAGNQTTVPLRLYFMPLHVTVTEPLAGSTVNTENLILGGSFVGPENTGITVNGIVALLDGDKFYVNNLPLMPGQNTLSIMLTAPDGTTRTQTVSVTSTGRNPLQVNVEPQSGIAPLTTRFIPTLNNGRILQRIDADANGDGTTDLTITDPTQPIEYLYNAPGTYRPWIIATDSQGQTYTQALVVVVQDPQKMDQFFTAIWNGMNNALKGGDVNAAVHYLNESAKHKYQPVFQALLPKMGEIVASYSPLYRLSVTEDIGEYAIQRSYNGGSRVYLTYFLKDADGVWRVDGM